MTITTGIYNFLPIRNELSTSGQPTEDQLRALASEDYNVIINLAFHDDPRYSLPNETQLVEELGMVYVHIPVAFDNPTEDKLLDFFDTMDRHKGKKILVHCAANMRVTAFLGLYDTIKQHQPEMQSFAPMKSIWQPDEIWSSFISQMIRKYTTSHAML
jgi:protein tyrosine phosphatase (PTP) superfamily phosphohydrolase (DUF442 family)